MINELTTYYKMPFDPSKLFRENGYIQECTLAESIAHNLMLLIMTKKGENRFDEEFGNDVWDIEFENRTTEAQWEEIFSKSMSAAIAKYEKRIYNAAIHVRITNMEQSYKMKQFTEIRKRASILINAKLSESGENYNFSTEIFLSPMSID